MFTIDGKEWALIVDASRMIGVSPQALRKWLQRHREVATKKVGQAKVVQLDSLREYQKREPRS
jgi:transposase-like protein